MLEVRPNLPAQALTDAELIGASLHQPERFAELYDRHAPALHRFAARRLGTQAAEDICAETFAVAFRRRTAFDRTYADARPWLFGIAVKLVGRQRRAEGRLLRALSRAVPAPPGDGGADAIHARLEAAAAGPTLARALAALPPEQRDVLLLVAWAELSYEEIARALGVPVGTVRSRLNRARRRVSETLAELETDTSTGGNR